MTFRPLISCLLLASLTNCDQKQPDTRQVAIDAIKSDQAQWLKDFQSRDVDKIVSHFSEDAIVVDKGGPPIKGREQAKRLYRGSAADPASSLTFAPLQVEVASSGDIGYVFGSYTSVDTVPNTHKTAEDRGTYISIYKKQQDGSWKDIVDMGSSEVRK